MVIFVSKEYIPNFGVLAGETGKKCKRLKPFWKLAL